MNYKETLERMHHQKLYYCNNEELMTKQEKCLDRLYDFNQTRPTEFQKRTELLKEMFAEIGEGCYIEPHFVQTGEDVTFILETGFMQILI